MCFRLVTMHAFDGRTDGQTRLSWLVRACIAAARNEAESTVQPRAENNGEEADKERHGSTTYAAWIR